VTQPGLGVMRAPANPRLLPTAKPSAFVLRKKAVRVSITDRFLGNSVIRGFDENDTVAMVLEWFRRDQGKQTCSSFLTHMKTRLLPL
jgi:hypothetical protein